MLPISIEPSTLADAFSLYCEHLKLTNPKLIPQLQTALFRYTLPGYGLPAESSKKDAVLFMKTILLHAFINALNVQQNYFTSLGPQVSSNSVRNYRMHLRKMLDWCSSQIWWKTATRTNSSQYCPRMILGRNAARVRLTNKGFLPGYRLQPSETSETLRKETQLFYKFMTNPSVYKRQDSAVRKSTADMQLKIAFLILGWLYRFQKVSLEDLSLSQLDSIELIYEHLSWLRLERNAHPKTECIHLKAWLIILKFLHHKASKAKKYRDIVIIEEIRGLINEATQRGKVTPPSTDESLKWLDWPDFLQCIEQLKRECSPRKCNGRIRPETAIAWSRQRYLLFALIACFPDRQRTFRELEYGKTLIKEGEQWRIEHTAKDFKTGNFFCKDGKKRVIILPKHIYPDLEDWLFHWRDKLNPSHQHVFTRKNGQPFTSKLLAICFQQAAYRITGKMTTPHIVRDMIVTHLKTIGASSAVMESLAEVMAHSLDMQRRSYDRRTSQQKVAPALDFLQQLNYRDYGAL